MRQHLVRVGSLLFLAAFLSAGCSSFKEQYIFRAGRTGKANYYRVTIKGRTLFTSSQFAAGLYDAEAVDALFGELSGPGKRISVDSTNLRVQSTNGNGSTETSSSSLSIVDGSKESKGSGAETVGGKSLKDQKFVFFLSSNADFFVNQIQTYVTTERMQTSVLTLLLKDDVTRLERAKLDGAAADSRAKTLKDAIHSVTTRLGDGEGKNAGDVRGAALDVLALIANRANVLSPPAFSDVEEAEKWLRDHPRAFQVNGGER